LKESETPYMNIPKENTILDTIPLTTSDNVYKPAIKPSPIKAVNNDIVYLRE